MFLRVVKSQCSAFSTVGLEKKEWDDCYMHIQVYYYHMGSNMRPTLGNPPGVLSPSDLLIGHTENGVATHNSKWNGLLQNNKTWNTNMYTVVYVYINRMLIFKTIGL